MTPLWRSLTTSTLFFIFFCPNLTAQQTPAKREVVGIALSGGGALGIAHVGVLRYLEEQRIPIDVIAGTSMGGLLGGLYATGHSVDDMERIVRTADWDDLLRSTPRFEDVSVSEKQEWNRITGVYSIPLRTGLALPEGINTGQALVRLLSGETAAYWDVDDFDNLPIPFRCVATDLMSGEAVVLGEGRLPEALRATMAIPGIFTPVEWNSRLLVDGGLVNNLPADVAKDMGADTIIAVTLRLPDPNTQDLQSLPSVVRQTMNIAVVQNERRNLSIVDIEIAVRIPGRGGLMDFRAAETLIKAGYEAAAGHSAALGKLALSQEQWAEHIRNRKSKERSLPTSGPLISISAPNAAIQQNATVELGRKTGSMTSRAQLDAALSGLTAATGLPNAFYGWHSESDRGGYQVKLETRRINEIVLRPSFFYQLSGNEPSRANVRVSGSAVRKDAYKSRFLAAVSLGSNPSVFFEYYHPFGGSPYFIAPGLALERAHFSQYSGDNRIDETRTRFAASLYFGIGTWRQLQLRVGTRAGLDRYSTPVTVNGVEATNTSFANPEITGIINSQDSGQLPTRGTRLNASAGWSFRKESFPYLEMNFDHFQPIRKFSVFATGRADTSMGRKLTFYDQFTAGGLTELDAYRYQEIRGNTLLMAGGGFLYRGANPNGTSFRPIFGSWYQAASVDWRTADSSTRQSASVGVFTPTPLGIVGMVVGFDLNGGTRFRLSIGSFWNRP